MENADVQSVIDELKAVRRQTSVWRSILVIVAVMVVLVCVLSLRNAVAGLAYEGPKQKEFLSTLGTQMQEQVLPQVQEVGTEAAQSINLNQQLTKLNERTPDVANAGLKEARLLASNLPAIGKEVLTKQFDTALQGRADKLKEAFPDATEEQLKQLMDLLLAETKTQVTDVTEKLFTPHITSMNNIVNYIDKIKAIEGPAAKQDIPTMEMTLLIFDIMREEYDVSKIDKAIKVGKELAQ